MEYCMIQVVLILGLECVRMEYCMIQVLGLECVCMEYCMI